MAILSTSLLAMLSLFYERGIYLDVALVLALVGFAGVVLFARFLDKGV